MARRIRLLDSEKDLAPYLWVILIAGALINIVHMYMVGAEAVFAQALFTGMATALILLLLFTVADLQHPCTGVWRITPEPYELLRERMEDVFRRDAGGKPALVPALVREAVTIVLVRRRILLTGAPWITVIHDTERGPTLFEPFVV